jgi:alcohol dehydrogenase class IV
LGLVLPPGEPKEATVDDCVAQARDAGVGSVVCVGGGSTIDAGKLVASLVLEGEAVAAYRLAAHPLPRQRLPLICAPTTAGTGAEATAVSVLSAKDGVKYWFWAASLKPDLILHDPAVTVALPAAMTASTGIDALVHAMEAATNLNASPTNNMFAYRAIELVTRWLPAAVRDPAGLEARARMLEAATLAGVAIDNAGTAIAHNIAHALGSLAPVAHGRAVAIGMCATLAWNVEAHPEAYEGVAQAMGVAGGAPALPAAFIAFVRSVGVDLTVEGVSADRLADQMGRPENAAMLNSNRRPASPQDLVDHAHAVLALGQVQVTA